MKMHQFFLVLIIISVIMIAYRIHSQSYIAATLWIIGGGMSYFNYLRFRGLNI